MNPTLAITTDRTAIRLSDTVTVTVAVEGAAPLRVAAPADVLAGDSVAVWSAARAGDPRTEALPGGRERWTQEYRCSPYAPGDGLPLEFAPFRVTAAGAVEAVSLSDKPLSFKVGTDLVGAKAEDARPVTGVETLPPVPPPGPVGLPAVWAIGGGGVLVLAAAVFATVRRRKRKPAVPPTAEAVAALDAATPHLHRVAEIVRRFLRRRFGLPTDTATTGELMAFVRELSGWPAERAEELERILSACDLAKFASSDPDAVTATEVRDRARSWVAAVGDAE
jgi:hypothetical protein